MEYTEEQIKFIQDKKPEFGLKVIPTLDSVIVEFLKKYEVYVKPASINKRTSGDVASGAVAGAIGGLAGADVAGDAFIVRGQKKQTEVQEWTQWKQWALDHKDFEDFRVKNIEIPKAHNLNVIEKLKNPEVQKELEPLLEEFEEFKKKQDEFNTKIMIRVLLFLSFLFFLSYVVTPFVESLREKNNSNTQAKLEYQIIEDLNY